MAKANRLPSVERSLTGEPVTAKPWSDDVAKKARQLQQGEVVTVPIPVDSAVIEVPIGPRSNGNLPRNCFIRLKGEQQKRALQRLRMGLVESQAKLKNGTAVSGNAHALQWVLEQIELS